MPKTGIEPISKSYKESVLPIKLYRLITYVIEESVYNSSIYIFLSLIGLKKIIISFVVAFIIML